MALPNGLRLYVRAADKLSVWSGWATAVLIVPMVLSLVWEVFARYLFTAPTPDHLGQPSIRCRLLHGRQ